MWNERVKEARLGSLAEDINKAMGKKTQVFSLWRQFLSSVRGKGIPVKMILHVYLSRWSAIGKVTQFRRELAVQEIRYFDMDDAQVPRDPGHILRQ